MSNSDMCASFTVQDGLADLGNDAAIGRQHSHKDKSDINKRPEKFINTNDDEDPINIAKRNSLCKIWAIVLMPLIMQLILI
jgi:hypothetical protein